MNNQFFKRTSLLSVSLLLAATFLPAEVSAKKTTKTDSEVTTTTTDSTSESGSAQKKSKSDTKTKSEKKTKKETVKSESSGPDEKNSAKKSSKKTSKEKKEETTTSATTTSTAGIADQKSDEILHQLADYYHHLKTFKTRLIQKLVASSDTKTVELLSVVDVGVKEPDSIVINLRAGMPGGSMYSDGDKTHFYSQILNKYIVKDGSDDIEKLFSEPGSRYVNGPYAMYSLLPSLVSKDPYASIMAGVKKVEYIGAEDVDGIACNHLRFTQDRFSWDLWVDAGKNPWVVKVTPDLFADIANSRALGRVLPKSTKMSLGFRYKNWVANPALKKSFFTFEAPPESSETKSFSPDQTEERSDKPEKIERKIERKVESEKKPLVGTEAPGFSLPLTNGEQMNLSKHKDKDVVVLDFWATWCPPCRASLPVLTKVTKTFADKHVVFYPVNCGESSEQVKGYLSKENIDVVSALDTDRKAASLYGANAIPQTVVLDKKGVIRFVEIGYSTDMEKTLTDRLNALTQDK